MENIQTKKKTLLIIEKPSVFKQLKQSKEFMALYNIRDITIHYAHTIVPYFKFNYPKKKKYKYYPYIAPLDFVFDENMRIENQFTTDKEYNEYLLETDTYRTSYKHLTPEFLTEFEDIIIATDPDHSGCFNALNELNLGLGYNAEDYYDNIYYLKLLNYSAEEIDNQIILLFNNKEIHYDNLDFFGQQFNYGSLKRFFEFNYQLNANVFVKELYVEFFSHLYQSKEELEDIYKMYGFTKFSLLALFLIADIENLTEEKVITILTKHSGTGKYKNNSIGIGTPASRGQIFENLYKLSCFKKVGVNSLEITPEAKLFINSFNKKMIDPDLPFRLDEWCRIGAKELKDGDSNIVDKMERYIKECFSAQKRKNYKIFSAKLLKDNETKK